jgi:hypothetical protein
MRHSHEIIGVGLLLLSLAACNAVPDPTPSPPPTATITASPTAITTRITPPPQRATLPATFTPTFTPTVTATPPPSLTPSVTPTLSVAALCGEFDLFFNDGDPAGLRYSAGDTLIVAAYLNVPQAVFTFVASHEATDAEIRLEQPGGAFYNMALDPLRMPESGRWDWVARVSDAERSDLCVERGHFFIDNTPAEAAPEITKEPEVTPEITPEPEG